MFFSCNFAAYLLKMIKKLTVFAASSSDVPEIYIAHTKVVGKLLAQAGIGIVYGGGGTGLMGALADAVLAHGGKVVGVMPHLLIDAERAHKGITKLISVKTMYARKRKLIHGSDGILVLAGGVGTFDEAFDAITQKKLGLYHKPIIFLNTNNYYAGLELQLAESITQKFMLPLHGQMYQFVRQPEEVLPAFENAPKWLDDPLKYAIHLDKK